MNSLVWLCIIVMVLLIFDSNINDSFTLPKLISLNIGIMALLAFEAFKTKRILPRNVLIPLGLYLFCLLLSVIASRMPSVAFYGLNNQWQGLYSQIMYAVLFALIVVDNDK